MFQLNDLLFFQVSDIYFKVDRRLLYPEKGGEKCQAIFFCAKGNEP